MRKISYIFSILLFLSFELTAQQVNQNLSDNPFISVQEQVEGEGKVTIHQSLAIEQMMHSYILRNQQAPGVDGFRIQLYSGTGVKARQEAQNIRSRFLVEYPDEKITVEYKAPFWNVRVGYFRHKHEALPLLGKLRPTFPNSYAVRDAGIKPELFE